MTDAKCYAVDAGTLEALETRQLMSGVVRDAASGVSGLAGAGNSVTASAVGAKAMAVSDGSGYTLAGTRQIGVVGGTAADAVAVAALSVPVNVRADGNTGTVADGVSGLTPATKTATPTAGSIAGLQLINTDTGKVVPGYTSLDGTETLNLARLPKHLTIAATLAGGAGTVRFDYDGKAGFRVEHAAPYALAGDASGQYRDATLGVGTHTLTANLVSGGKVLSGHEVTLKIINQPKTGGTATAPVGPSNGNTDAAHTPDAAITAVCRTVPAGTSVNVDALASKLKGGDWNDGHYYWNFGDPGSEENSMRGFNAAHVYDKAGTYTVTLKVVNAAGISDVTTLTVTVTPANRTVIYVSNNGSDANTGLSQNSPIKTLAKALTLVHDNTEIRFRRGDEFDQTASFQIKHSNVVVGAYGMGDRPKILWTGDRENEVMFYVGVGTSNVTVENLSIDTVYDQDTNDHGTPMAFKMGGTNFTARGNELLNLQYGFMLNLRPTGVNIVDNTAPSTTGVRKYFAWVEGSQVTIADNYCANSTREHIVRCNFVHLLNISGNDFSNISRQDAGDVWDYRKTAVNVQSGDYAYVYGNKLNASLQVGPLGKENGMKGENSAGMRFNYAIAEDNEVINDQIVVNHGAQHVTFRDNVVHDDNGQGFAIDGYDDTYQRGVVDLKVENNTVTNDGTHGSFIDVYGAVDGIVMTGNLYLAPHLTIGSYETAPVKIAAKAYDSFTTIDGNLWPVAAKVVPWAGEGAINYVGDGYSDKDNFKTPAEWNAMSIVGTDFVDNVTPTDGYSLVYQGHTVGANLAA